MPRYSKQQPQKCNEYTAYVRRTLFASFAHERQVNIMASKTFDEWCDSVLIIPSNRSAVLRNCWDAAIKSLEDVQNQTTNNARDEILLCADERTSCSTHVSVCTLGFGKCTMQRKTSPVA